jgi:arabinofuranan 3-O-arabinosyltransferase
VTTSVAVVAAAAVISGILGIIVGGAALGLRYVLRSREKLCEAVTVGLAAGGLILAGAVLSQNPWRSVDGYVGHSAGVQLLALVSVAMLAASTVPVNRRSERG